MIYDFGVINKLMKLALWFGLFWATLLPVAAPGSLSKLERISISGTDHVRLEDWARANNFQTRWTVPKQEIKLTSSSATLSFTIDSARISVNGIRVWLSSPIALRAGSACIAAVDLTAALHPLLFPTEKS